MFYNAKIEFQFIVFAFHFVLRLTVNCSRLRVAYTPWRTTTGSEQRAEQQQRQQQRFYRASTGQTLLQVNDFLAVTVCVAV